MDITFQVGDSVDEANDLLLDSPRTFSNPTSGMHP
jgi:hypothetical protein